MTSVIIWTVAAALYCAFYIWYVGFQSKLTPAEIDAICRRLKDVDPERMAVLRKILTEDTGREFYMVNLLKFHEQNGSIKSSMRQLLKYSAPFTRELLKRAGHPIALTFAASAAVELWGIENAEKWDFAAFMRYRSRRDMAEMIVSPAFHDNHEFKRASLEKTFAFVGDPVRIAGGPKLLIPVLLFAIAAGLTLLFG